MRINAALVAEAGVGDDAGGATGAGGAVGVEIGALDEDIDGVDRAAGALATHHAAKADGAAVVSDDAHVGEVGIGLAVECDEAVACVPRRATMPPVSLAAS